MYLGKRNYVIIYKKRRDGWKMILTVWQSTFVASNIFHNFRLLYIAFGDESAVFKVKQKMLLAKKSKPRDQ
jgi:hypothetical protein